LSPRLVVVIVLVVSAVVGGSGFLLAGGSDDEDESDQGMTSTTDDAGGPITTLGSNEAPSAGDETPEATVDAFVAAAAEGDCEAMLALVTDDFVGEPNPADCVPDQPLDVYGVLQRSGPATVDGGEARVSTDDPAAEEGSTSTVVDYYLIDAGTWVIDGINIGGNGVVPSDGPEATIEEYGTASAERDCEALLALVTDNHIEGQSREDALVECQGWSQADFDVFGDLQIIGEPEIDGDTAVVPVDIAYAIGRYDFTVVNQDGAWLIDHIDA
jgi:hypothetical protein